WVSGGPSTASPGPPPSGIPAAPAPAPAPAAAPAPPPVPPAPLVPAEPPSGFTPGEALEQATPATPVATSSARLALRMLTSTRDARPAGALLRLLEHLVDGDDADVGLGHGHAEPLDDVVLRLDVGRRALRVVGDG